MSELIRRGLFTLFAKKQSVNTILALTKDLKSGLTVAPSWKIYEISKLAKQILGGEKAFEPGDTILESVLISTKDGEVGNLKITFEEIVRQTRLKMKVTFGERESSISIGLRSDHIYIANFLNTGNTFEDTGLGHIVMQAVIDLALSIKNQNPKITQIKLVITSVDFRKVLRFYIKQGFIETRNYICYNL